MSKHDDESREEIVLREVEIVELDERLDMSVDPFLMIFNPLDAVCPNIGCKNTNCAGGNCVSGCGS